VAEEQRSYGALGVIIAGVVIGGVEVVLAVCFAALVFGSYLVNFLPNGIGLYLVAATLTLGILAWRAGPRGVVGSVQDAAAAVLAVIAVNTAAGVFGSPDRAFLSVVATTLVVTLLTGVAFLVLGIFRLGNLARYVPYPVVGGFLAGTGWLLFKGGVGVGAALTPSLSALGQLFKGYELQRWVPAVLFGVILLGATQLIKRPFVIPAVLALGFVAFGVGLLVTGSSIETAKQGGWLIGPFPPGRLLQPWTFRAISGADWGAVLGQFSGIVTTVFVAVLAALFNVSGIELMLRKDFDTNREMRDLGIVNVVSSFFGGIPGYHALSLTSLAQRMRVNARAAGLVAALVPLAGVVVGSSVIQLIPRMIVGGVLVFVGLSFLFEWLVVLRRSLPAIEYGIVLVILGTIAAKGFLTGVVVGLVMALFLFAVNYSRIELVREVQFGTTYRSNADRPAPERQELAGMADRVQILLVSGFVFFGTANGLLERIRKRVEAGPIRFLVVDLRRVTGMDSSAVLSFRKVAQLAVANGFELLLSGGSDRVERQLRRGGVVASEGVVRFEPDLDRALQHCEDGLLPEVAAVSGAAGNGSAVADGELPDRLRPYLERRELAQGAVLLRQGDPPDDVFVLESGRLSVEATTPDGVRMRLRSMLPGVMVGEIAMYTGASRTADVVAETPSVVLRLGRDSIARMEAEEPELAAALHRWLAKTLAERLSDTMRAFDAMLD
jgi:sulfate permease, SulP family